MEENDLRLFWKLSKFWIDREVVECTSVDIFTLGKGLDNCGQKGDRNKLI